MCEAGVSGHEYLFDMEFLNAVTCTYADPIGLAVLGLVVYGAIGLSLYIRTGSVMIPFVLILTTGGAIMTQVASPAVAVVAVTVLCTGAGAVAYLYRRYSR